MANISVTNTFTNGTTADASQVNQNFTDIINGTSDGTKDFSINALTLAGTFTANGNVNLGNASADDLSITASLASSIPIKTTASFDIGSSTLGLRALYLGVSTFTTKLATAATASWTFTFPVTAGTSRYRLETDGSGNTSWVKSFTSSSDIRNASLAVSLAGNAMTITLKGADGNDPSATNPVIIVFRNATATTGSLSEVVVTSALSITVSSGSTLGTTSAVESKINVYAINNAGTVELAVANLGATSTDGRVTTTAEGGGGAADSGTVFYSTTARTNVACRLLGAIVSTQATAGTWATAITSILTVGCGMVFGAAISDPTTFTPTGTWSTNSTYTGNYWRVGDKAFIKMKVALAGAPTSATLNFNLPSGIVLDTAKLLTAASTNYMLGKSQVYDASSGGTYQGRIRYSSTSAIQPVDFSVATAQVDTASITQALPMTFATGDYVEVEVENLPVVGWFARDWIVG